MYSDPELTAAVKRLGAGSISVFSFPGSERYDALPVEVHVDKDGFPWVNHGGRRLWFRQGSDPAAVARNYRRLLQEQDPASPHCYRPEGFSVGDGDVLLDVGSAEGIFALDNVERAARVMLFEVDPAWIGALERTFEPWRDKVAIINRYASDVDDEDNTTIDTAVKSFASEKGALFLKLDVEGAEERVLRGAEAALARSDTRAVVCTYHRHDDHRRLSEVMREQGFEVATSPGYMLFILDRDLRPPFFRRGVIYCRKGIVTTQPQGCVPRIPTFQKTLRVCLKFIR
jgi:hypothetical protein